MSPESFTQLARQNKPERPEKTQEELELRSALEKNLFSLKPTIEEEVKKYKEALESDVFEDKEGEPEGSGEKRKEEIQNRINSIIDRASAIKERLDSKEPPPQSSPEISASYTHPDGKKETITLDLETKLQDFISFYKKTKVDLPPDFENAIRDLWERSQVEIEQAIERNGFDEMLVIPATPDIGDLSKKMKMGNGYYDYIKNFTVQTLDGVLLTSQNVGKPRLILVHKTQNLKDRPELKQTLNIKGKNVKMDQALALEDYLVFQRKYFEETGQHLDKDGCTWLATKAGARLVYSYWNSGKDKLDVYASKLGDYCDYLGVRPSRSFF